MLFSSTSIARLFAIFAFRLRMATVATSPVSSLFTVPFEVLVHIISILLGTVEDTDLVSMTC